MSNPDYYLVPVSLPVSAKMHILTNGLANFGSNNGELITNSASNLTLSVNGNVNSGGNIGGSVGVVSSPGAPYYSLNPTGGTSNTAIIIPNGTTDQRPSTTYSLSGYLRYNIDASYSTLEYYRKTQDAYVQLYSPPIATDISPISIPVNVTSTITITGTNFDTAYPMSVIFYSNQYIASYTATTVNVSSTNSMTVTVPSGVSDSISNGPYSIRIISNFTGMGNTLFNKLSVYNPGSSAFVWTAPSTLNTVYTSLQYSQTTFVNGTYGATAPPRIVATYNGAPVKYYKFNPASSGYADVSNAGIVIDSSGYITTTIANSSLAGNPPTIPNGYVLTQKTLTSLTIIAGSSPTYDASSVSPIPLQLIFQPLLLRFTTIGQTVPSSPTYAYTYNVFTNSTTPIVPPTSQVPSTYPTTDPSINVPPPASSAIYTLTLDAAINGTSIYSADPSFSYIDFLIVGGGGGGGTGYQGGGGGGGGVVSSGNNPYTTYNYNIGSSGGGGSGVGPFQMPQGLTAGAAINISVGGGGPGGYYYNTGTFSNPYNNRSGNGGNSFIKFPNQNWSYTAYGGGGGSGEQNISDKGVSGSLYMALPGGCGGGTSHGMNWTYNVTGNNSYFFGNYDNTNGSLTITDGYFYGFGTQNPILLPFQAVYQGNNRLGFIPSNYTGANSCTLTNYNTTVGPLSNAQLTFHPGWGLANQSGNFYPTVGSVVVDPSCGSYALGINANGLLNANNTLVDVSSGYQGYNGGSGWSGVQCLNNLYVLGYVTSGSNTLTITSFQNSSGLPNQAYQTIGPAPSGVSRLPPGTGIYTTGSGPPWTTSALNVNYWNGSSYVSIGNSCQLSQQASSSAAVGLPGGIGSYTMSSNSAVTAGSVSVPIGFQLVGTYYVGPFNGAGGGGAGANGGASTGQSTGTNPSGTAGSGGNGIANYITTALTSGQGSGTGTYGGGGGGSNRSATGTSTGGTGGGGAGVNAWSSPSSLAGNGSNGTSTTNGTGVGGGGGGSAGGSGGNGVNGQYGGSGGSGLVIIRYRSN